MGHAGFAGTFRSDVCITFAGPGDPEAEAVGSFRLWTPHGAVLTGDVNGVFDTDPPTAPFPFEFTLTPVSGTKAFKHATGVLFLDAVWDGGGGPDRAPGNFSGTLVGSLQR